MILRQLCSLHQHLRFVATANYIEAKRMLGGSGHFCPDEFTTRPQCISVEGGRKQGRRKRSAGSVCSSGGLKS